MILVFSIIFIAIAIICSFDIICIGPVMNVSPWFFVFAVVVSTVFQFAIDGVFAFVVSKFPNKWFKVDSRVFNVSKKEQRLYEKLGIRGWKDKVWELGGIGGFSKSKLESPNDPAYAERFLIESYKGEVDHWFGMFVGFLDIFIFPIKFALYVGIPVAIVNLVLNFMPIMILRYNTPKLKVLYKRALRNQNLEKK